MIYGKLKAEIGTILRQLCEQKEVEIIEAKACKDHIHMLVSIPPSLGVADFPPCNHPLHCSSCCPQRPYEVIISEEARRQLGQCVLFIAKDHPEAAQRLRERLVSGIRSLTSMLIRYPFFQEPYISKNKYHKMFVEN